MKKWLVFVLALILVVAAGWWIWSLGSVPAEPTPQVTLQVDAQPVQVQRAGQTAWTNGNTGDVLLPGDSVRTAPSGAASLEIFGQGESRLAANSQVTIQSAQHATESGMPLVVDLQLVSGRVWSRVLRLFDAQSTYDVRTDTVVATVRGTAFDMNVQATGTVLWVSSAAVQVSAAKQGSLAPSADSQTTVSEGLMANFDPDGKLLSSQAISDSAKQTDWFISNSNRDTAFVSSTDASIQTRFNGMRAETPGSLLDDVAKISEWTHLAFAGDGAPELYARYAARRLAAIKTQMDHGSPGAALQAYSAEEEDINAHANGPDGAAYRISMQHELVPVFMLLQDVVPSSPSYPLKQKLEDLNVTLAGTDQLETAYARLLAIDARLDEASNLIGSASFDDAQGLLNTALQGIQNVERDIDHLPDDTPADQLDAVRAKLYGLKARETSISVKLATAITPPTSQFPLDVGSTTSTSSTLVTVPTAPTSTDETVSSTASAYVSLELSASPSPATAGDEVRLVAKAVDANGDKTDVTGKTQFSVASSAASVNGPVLSALAPGNVTVHASFTDNGQPFTATLSLPILRKPAVLQSLIVLNKGGAVLSYGETASITVMAEYSDGSQKDVTASSELTSSNTVLGYFTSNLFHAGSTAAGTDSVIATYKEGTVTKTSSLDIEIVSR
ncbi:MAG: FecR domain-containing protein [Patescibacteria group bacterium]